jgi:transposase
MKIAEASSRVRNRLKGTEAIALRVGRVIDHFKMAKHFELSITDSGFSWVRKTVQIQQEAALDGLYVVRTSLPAAALSAEAAVTAYKSLAVVERAFRSLKTVDLQVRPIFHWNVGRVRAHVFLCMLAYYVEWGAADKAANLGR